LDVSQSLHGSHEVGSTGPGSTVVVSAGAKGGTTVTPQVAFWLDDGRKEAWVLAEVLIVGQFGAMEVEFCLRVTVIVLCCVRVNLTVVVVVISVHEGSMDVGVVEVSSFDTGLGKSRVPLNNSSIP
jgi:hypothetical protein